MDGAALQRRVVAVQRRLRTMFLHALWPLLPARVSIVGTKLGKKAGCLASVEHLRFACSSRAEK